MADQLITRSASQHLAPEAHAAVLPVPAHVFHLAPLPRSVVKETVSIKWVLKPVSFSFHSVPYWISSSADEKPKSSSARMVKSVTRTRVCVSVPAL